MSKKKELAPLPQGELVFLKGDNAFTDTMQVAQFSGYEHKTVAHLVRAHKAKFERSGKLGFRDLKSLNPQGGRPTRIYLLNEEQAAFLIALMGNSEIVVELKYRLSVGFVRMRRFIAERHSGDWQNARITGKAARRSLTDVIKDWVDYAIKQGSTHAKHYYENVSKLVNRIVGISDRDTATTYQLLQVGYVESLFGKLIEQCMGIGMAYRDIYAECKRFAERFVSMLNPVPQLAQPTP